MQGMIFKNLCQGDDAILISPSIPNNKQLQYAKANGQQ
jgi:hypothetical protein